MNTYSHLSDRFMCKIFNLKLDMTEEVSVYWKCYFDLPLYGNGCYLRI